MRIVIAADGSAELENPAEFTSFVIAASDTKETSVLAALGGGGSPSTEANHVFVAVSTVRALASAAADESWETGFARMLAYADSQGWTNSAGTLIKAHIEPLSTTKD